MGGSGCAASWTTYTVPPEPASQARSSWAREYVRRTVAFGGRGRVVHDDVARAGEADDDEQVAAARRDRCSAQLVAAEGDRRHHRDARSDELLDLGEVAQPRHERGAGAARGVRRVERPSCRFRRSRGRTRPARSRRPRDRGGPAAPRTVPVGGRRSSRAPSPATSASTTPARRRPTAGKWPRCVIWEYAGTSSTMPDGDARR